MSRVLQGLLIVVAVLLVILIGLMIVSMIPRGLT